MTSLPALLLYDYDFFALYTPDKTIKLGQSQLPVSLSNIELLSVYWLGFPFYFSSAKNERTIP